MAPDPHPDERRSVILAKMAAQAINAGDSVTAEIFLKIAAQDVDDILGDVLTEMRVLIDVEHLDDDLRRLLDGQV